jgi:sRNA-binding regulator protein Hfq
MQTIAAPISDLRITMQDTIAARRPTLGVSHHANTATMPAPVAPKKPPVVAKGHDAILKGLQDARSLIAVNLISTDVPTIGNLVMRDRYTISLRIKDGRIMTIYKHAIESFTTVPAPQQGPAA